MPYEFENIAWLSLTPTLFIVYQLLKNKIRFWKNAHIDRISLYIPFDDIASNNASTTKKIPLVNWLLIFLISISLAQPVTKTKVPVSPERTNDIFFIIDTSVGMSIKDYLVNDEELDRLSLVKALLIEFVTSLTNNRIGTIVYAENAYVLTPLTTDKELVVANIKRIRSAVAGRRNNLEKALNTYLQYSKTLGSKPTVVVLSQGSNLEGSGNIDHVVSRFRNSHIKLHFVGVGSEKLVGTSSNKLIYDPINRDLLSGLANKTGGDFFWAGNEKSLDSSLKSIKSTETIIIPDSDNVFKQQFYMWPLYLFLLILFFRQAILSINRFKK